MANKKGLGRGLESLFDQNFEAVSEDNTVVEIALNDIEPNPFQPRKHFDQDALLELAESIKIQGVLQPILVRRALIGYEIISGERRYRASKLAEKETIPAIVYEFEDNQMMEVGIIENIQREDLSVIEEAHSYQMLIDKLGLTQNEVSQRVGKSRSHIANMLRLLRLDNQIIAMIEDNLLTMGHAKVLVTIEDKQTALEIAKQAVEQSLNVREVEYLAKVQKNDDKQKDPIEPTPEPSEKSNEYKRLETIMRDKLDTQVKIVGKNKGKISIDYDSREELERIIEVLNIF